MAKIGYARTSTLEQVAGFEAQIRDLIAAGCCERDIYREQVSSVKARPELELVLSRILRAGDELVVTRIDRLARSISDLVAIIGRVRAAGAELVILDMGSTNPKTAVGEFMVNMLGVVAQFERRIMLERQREGIAKAKAEGKYKGQPPHARAKAPQVLAMAAEGKRRNEIAAELGISERSVYRILADAAAAGAGDERAGAEEASQGAD